MNEITAGPFPWNAISIGDHLRKSKTGDLFQVTSVGERNETGGVMVTAMQFGVGFGTQSKEVVG